MRQIQPVNILVKGEYVPANYFDIESIYDNLKTKATFQYSYISVTTDPVTSSDIIEVLQREKIQISGQDYIDWGANTDINDAAFVWVANQINVVYI